MTTETTPATTQPSEQAPPWHGAFPSPETTPGLVSRMEVLEWLQADRSDFILIDVRRTDCEGGMIKGSINLPAMSMYYTIPRLHKLFAAAGIRNVVFFCSSSKGRGPRAAGWFADILKKLNDSDMASLILEGGIKGWVAAGKEHIEWMDGYEESAWPKSS